MQTLRISALAAAVGLLCALPGLGLARREAAASAGAAAGPGMAAGAQPAEKPTTMAELIDRAEKWVVAIEVEREKDLPSNAPNVKQMPKEIQEYYKRPPGWVSGILVDADGHVVTSYYNVAGQVKSLKVMVAGVLVYPAKLIAKSLQDDIALLRIDRPDGEAPIPFSEPLWADASALRGGQIIFAIGRSPDPKKLTTTRGILSATGRNGGRAVQTDAELNYGNVGGPILDLDGRIVAMAAFVGHTYPQWGVNSGVGFGTTGSALLGMLPQLKKGEDFVAFRFPFIGIRGDRSFVAQAGAKLDLVQQDSPAAQAGLRVGDLITEFEGAAVENFDHLRRMIFTKKVGDKVKLKLRRGEETIETEVTLAEAPAL